MIHKLLHRLVIKPFYVTVKYGRTVDVYWWSTEWGDIVEDNGDGTFDYRSQVYTVPTGGPSISQVGVVGELPEPTSLAIWGLIAGIGMIAAYRRRAA